MRTLNLFFLIFGSLLFVTLSLRAQEYNYIRYDTRDGLAGSTVYSMVQDKEGFLWFATDAGLSRFDGTHFRNFTTADGLPEAEIIKLYMDQKGRVWIAPFKNTVCYYYEGKLHTAANDSLLRLVKIDGVVSSIGGDHDDNIFIAGGRFGYILQTKPGHEKLIDLRPFQRHFVSGEPNYGNPKELLLITYDSAFIWRNGRIIFSHKNDDERKEGILVTQSSQKSAKYVNYKEGNTLSTFLKWTTDWQRYNVYLAGSTGGAYLIDSTNFDRIEEKFLPGKRINTVWIDFESNLWFGTAGEGVYKLISRNFKTFTFPDNRHPEIFSLDKTGNSILAGGGYNKLYTLRGSVVEPAPFVAAVERTSRKTFVFNRLVAIAKTSNGNLLLGFDLFLYQSNALGGRFSPVSPIKSLLLTGGDTLLVATGRNVVRMRAIDLAVYDTIWPTRSTCVGYSNRETYVGTVDGLYVLSDGQKPRYLGAEVPALRYRIAAISRAADGSVWIASFGGGIVGLKDNKVFVRLTTREGLLSDICRTLFMQNGFLWIGTDKGVNKLDLSRPFTPVRQYTVADGLPSNIINAIYADSNQVYIGSPAGLTTFDEKQVSEYSRCDLKLLNFTVSGRQVAPDSIGDLAYYDNDIAIDFVAISFKSGGDILYRYRLRGLKDSWDSTRQNTLSYPSLPPGDYRFELVATNKFGVESNTLIFPFVIKLPFWQKWWFLLTMALSTIGLTAALVSWRFSILRKREREKASLEEKVSKLEQLALLSQMNPHFIFNCLNSIQSFIINNDLETTNQYLTDFAHLIRQTMEGAEKGTITVAKEVSYLSRYIELEKMRFGHSFDFAITVDDQIDAYHLSIPSMILQPYVENSIRHGIRFKADGRGLVQVKFRQYGSRLTCIVEDNGIGRVEAGRLRSKVHVEYQSKGMTLAADRIQALNRQAGTTVSIDVIDMVDHSGKASGTRVEIHFPISLLLKFS